MLIDISLGEILKILIDKTFKTLTSIIRRRGGRNGWMLRFLLVGSVNKNILKFFRMTVWNNVVNSRSGTKLQLFYNCLIILTLNISSISLFIRNGGSFHLPECADSRLREENRKALERHEHDKYENNSLRMSLPNKQVNKYVYLHSSHLQVSDSQSHRLDLSDQTRFAGQGRLSCLWPPEHDTYFVQVTHDW